MRPDERLRHGALSTTTRSATVAAGVIAAAACAAAVAPGPVRTPQGSLPGSRSPILSHAAAAGATTSAAPTATGADGSTPLRIVVGGDVNLGRGVAARAAVTGWPALWTPLGDSLRAADIAIVNLESPLGHCLPGGTVQSPRLCGSDDGLSALAAAGIDGVTLANNHGLDAGPDGLMATGTRLRAAGIHALGVGTVLTGEPRLERVGALAVIAANITPIRLPPGRSVPIPSPAEVAGVVRGARDQLPAAPILVLLHGGRELDDRAQPRDGDYIRAIAAAGASAIVMHGAHVVRPAVVEDGVPVHLGLGNLLFDQRPLPGPRRAMGGPGGVLLHLVAAGPSIRFDHEDTVPIWTSSR